MSENEKDNIEAQEQQNLPEVELQTEEQIRSEESVQEEEQTIEEEEKEESSEDIMDEELAAQMVIKSKNFAERKKQEKKKQQGPEKQPEKQEEEVQPKWDKNPDRPPIPVIDHRLLAGKLNAYDWLSDLPAIKDAPEIVEVRFKNTRKAFFSNPLKLDLKPGEIVAVEAALGHDIGIISLAGELVKEQIWQKRIDLERNPLKKVYRKAKPHDIEKWQQAIAFEHETMIRSRKIAADLKLNMKIGDVEYQGDKTKAIFYYIADDRVDFRALIKVLADTFHIRIEMKQIGARQEAGRIGGIGPCGLKLCCSTFITNFVSVSTSAARYQDISLNPQKLAGQCGKLKCCLNYEVDAYMDEQKDFPSANITLNTGEGMLYHQKTDIFGRCMYYAFDREGKGIFIKLPIRRIKEIITQNRKGIIPAKAMDEQESVPEDIKYTDGVGEDSLNRFDEKKQKKNHSKNRGNNREGENRNNDNRNNGNRQNNNGNRQNNNGGRQDNNSNRQDENRPAGNRSKSLNRNRQGQRPQQNSDQKQEPKTE